MHGSVSASGRKHVECEHMAVQGLRAYARQCTQLDTYAQVMRAHAFEHTQLNSYVDECVHTPVSIHVHIAELMPRV